MLQLFCQCIRNRMTFRCLLVFFSICKEFEAIRDRALKVPETTEDMIEMITYIDQVKTKGIEELNNEIMVGTVPQNYSLLNVLWITIKMVTFYNTFSRKHNTGWIIWWMFIFLMKSILNLMPQLCSGHKTFTRSLIKVMRWYFERTYSKSKI